jgi:glycerophosphoryl diester phosphodiesterase
MVVYGHRGARGYAPENTVESFRKALELGADGVEMDVHLSRDGEVVVIHDDTVDRTTDGTGAVGSMTLAQLKRLDAGVRFGKEWAGARIPTLTEVFEALGRVNLRIELKHSGKVYPGIEQRLVSQVEDAKMKSLVEVTSFDYDAIEAVKGVGRGLRTGIIVHGKVRWFAPIAKGLGSTWVHARSDLLTGEDSEAAHREGLMLGVWTVNDEEGARRAVEIGADGVTSDFPDRVIGAVRGPRAPRG